MTDKKNTPNFRIDKFKKPPQVWLQCSECSKDIRRIHDHESILLTRAYHCADCDPGVISLNPPTTESKDGDSK